MVTENVLHVGPNKYRIYLVVLNSVFTRETCPVSGVRKDSNFIHTWTECDMNIIKQHKFHCIIIMLFSCFIVSQSIVQYLQCMLVPNGPIIMIVLVHCVVGFLIRYSSSYI